MNTFQKIDTAISNATINGNFNSDLIEDKEIRRLALLTYINKTVKKNPESALRDYETADSYVYSEIGQYDYNQKHQPIIIVGGKTALVIEKSADYILAKFNQPTFEDKPYFTIGYVLDSEFQDSFFSGHYDLSLVDATNDFINRNQ